MRPDLSFEGVKRSVLNGVTIFCKSFYQHDGLLKNYGPLKISFLQILFKRKSLYQVEVLEVHQLNENQKVIKFEIK